MTSKTPVSRGRRQSGNAILEGALVFLPFFAIIFGIADFSMSAFIMGLLQEDAREACRFATTYNLTYKGTTYSTQTAAIKQIMIDGSLGFITSSTVGNYVQLNFYFPDNLSTVATSSALPYTWTDSKGQTQTISYVNNPGNVVEVRVVGFPWNWMVPLPNFMPGTKITFGAEAVDILQGLPVGTTSPPSP
jgi:Flp pilus assembly protein TadG